MEQKEWEEPVIDDMRMFMGKGIQFNDTISFYSPPVAEIAEIGEAKYTMYINVLLLNQGLIPYFYKIEQQILEELLQMDRYQLFITFDRFIDLMKEALTFFCKTPVEYHVNRKFFYANDDYMVMNSHNYRTIGYIIKAITGLKDKHDDVKFRNQKARELYEKAKKTRERQSQQETLRLRDILSILCHADGNGIHIFNIGQLTIYQVYEHFERLHLRESHSRVLQVWANGLLGKEEKLPEWMVKGTI